MTEHCSTSVQAAHMNRSSFHMYLMHEINMNKHQNILFQPRNTPFFKFKSTEVKLSGTQNKYFKGIPLAYCCYCGSQQQHGLTLRTFLYLVILKKVQFSRARWLIAMAAHNKYYKCFIILINTQYFNTRHANKQLVKSENWSLYYHKISHLCRSVYATCSFYSSCTNFSRT